MKELESDRLEREEADARISRIMKARQAIVAHAGKYRKGVSCSVSGAIDCPVCGGVKTLHFRRAACNGHIAAQCTADGCVSWME